MESIQEIKSEDNIFDEIKSLREMILNFEKQLKKTENRYESSELNELYTALAKAQLEMEIAKTDSSNPFFKSKYADLASVVKASRPFLAKNGLGVSQFPRETSEGSVLHTRLCHSSGQWLESQMALKPLKADPQTLGSTLTYLKRYMYASLVGVVASDEDDDGETAMASARSNSAAPLASQTITKAQLQILSQELDGFEDLLESILKGFKISKLSDLLSKHYTQCITRIKEIKRAKEA